MEVVRVDGYTVEEKVAIACDYLWPRQLKRNGLEDKEVEITNDALRQVVSSCRRLRQDRGPAWSGVGIATRAPNGLRGEVAWPQWSPSYGKVRP